MLISLAGNRDSIIENNTFSVTQTVLSATATKIELPDTADEVMIRHLIAGVTVWLGEDSAITAAGTVVFPLEYGDTLVLQLKKGNNNNLYGILDTGTGTIFVAGVIKQ